MYNLFIDNQRLETHPKGFEKFVQKITRSIPNRRITITYPTDLVFYGDGFEILWGAVESYGYDKVFEFRAEKVDEQGFISNQVFGKIFMIDVEFDLVKKTATAQVKENGFISKMLGNINNPISLPAKQTKNGLEMPSASRVNVDVDVGALGGLVITHSGLRKGVDVFEGLKELVLNMSDNEVTLTSEWYENQLEEFLQIGNRLQSPLCMIRGRELRLGSDRTNDYDYNITLSYEELFSVWAKLYNLYFYPNTNVQPPEIVIGNEGLFYPPGNASSPKVESPENMKVSYFQELFFSRVKLGTSSVLYTDGNTATNLPDVPWVTFKDTEYYLSGDSNIDQRKDLSVSGFVYDSNIIRDVLVNQNESYDDQIFIIQYLPQSFKLDEPYIGVTPYERATTFSILDDGQGNGFPAFNGGLLSSEIAKNHNYYGQIRQNLTDIEFDNRVSYKVLNSDVKQYIALKGTQYYGPTLYPTFSEVLFDYSDGHYNITTGEYTAQIGGVYSFDVDIALLVTALSNESLVETGGNAYPEDFLEQIISLEILDGANVVQTIVLSNKVLQATGSYKSSSLATAYMKPNEKARVVINYYANGKAKSSATKNVGLDRNIEWRVMMPDSKFAVSSTPNLSIRFTETQETHEYKGTRVILNHFLTEEQLKNVLANPERAIKLLNFGELGTAKDCWISSMQINRETGNIEAELITNIINEEL